MKKLSLLFLVLLACGAAFQSCDNTKTYAEMLEDERNAINTFLTKHNYTIISQEEFERDTTTGPNEFVSFPNGVYMHIEKRGTGDTIRSGDEILVRMKEYNMMHEINSSISGDTLSNVEVASLVDAFIYNPSASATKFTEGYFPILYGQQGLTVPAGMTFVLRYLNDMARVKLIIPSKVGHDIALQYVYPYYYDIRKIQVR